MSNNNEENINDKNNNNNEESTATVGSGIADYIGQTLFGKDYNQVDNEKDQSLRSDKDATLDPKALPDDTTNENFKPDSDKSTENNVTEKTADKPNPLGFLLRRRDKADENEQRLDARETAKHQEADNQRLKIAEGTYEDGNIGSYYGAAAGTEFADHAAAEIRGDYSPTRGYRNRLDEEQEREENGSPSDLKFKKPRPPLGGRWTDRSERELVDEDEVHQSWKRRFSKFAGTPTAVSFGNNGGAETPSGEGRKWRDFKTSILGFKKKDRQQSIQPRDIKKEQIERELDEKTKKRAEFLLSSLTAGCPAALFASSIFLRDEHGTQRAPLLLSLLGFQLTDITENPRRKQKTFRIDLEYGLSPNRLRWSIIKDTKDFLILHSRLKVLFFQSTAFSRKDVDLPKFPRYDHQAKLARSKLLKENPDNLVLDGGITDRNGEQYVVPTNLSVQSSSRPLELQHLQAENESIASVLSHSSGMSHHVRNSVSNALSRMHSISSKPERDPNNLRMVNELYKESVENYINQLALTLTLRPQSNRVFQFFELSPIGVLLSSENGYQGKQGYLLVRTSAKAQGWRVGHLKLRELKDMVERHTSKWFLIRNSYIMYVDDIYSTTPLEVFLIDADTTIHFTGDDGNGIKDQQQFESDDEYSLLDEPRNSKDVKKKSPYLVIKLLNRERKMKMIVKSEKQLNLWVNSINTMMSKTVWSQPKRFDSFAPIRTNCFAQWFVDARDYMWACSSALEMAKETIYIHDWWLSPELYMRRPANGNQQWRIDRILKRKAEQGVKIFVIVYRNVGNTVVTDSSWTKHSLLDLHPNIYVIRSPNQLLQNTYFWAHHEKLCIIDSTISFLGGIDLCFGRFDTPDHILTDDADSAFPESDGKRPGEDDVRFQYFPGKDYSNPRVKDFFSLDKPYESMYNRKEIPRMPWHDVHMVSAGQVARDLSRHFVQRWNYLLRQKRPSRPTPLLLPPSDLTQLEINEMGLDGTCEVQLLRSSGSWSLGLKEHEQSIQNAYLKVIETSEHFVYLENQFFVTSAEWDGTVIHNRIGDALVDRIIRAHHEGTNWRAVIVIPLMPGFESQVSEADGSAVRVIMQCQFMSISRGSTSIFAKLRKVGIDPDDYIQFFSLRKWGRIGPDKKLVTEQLYIHAKTLMADDKVAIIGSANINERSMRGDRDSEVAAVVRDKEMIKTTMNGKPYLAGKFAHTLRMRLMREHLGVDVDILELVERRFNHLEAIAKTDTGRLASTGKFSSEEYHISSAMVELASREVLNQHKGTKRWFQFIQAIGGKNDISIPLDGEQLPESLKNTRKYAPHPLFHSFNHRAGTENLGMRDKKKFSSDSRIHNNKDHKNDIDGFGRDRYKSDGFKKYSKSVKNIVKEWAKDAITPQEPYLPNAEQVLDYLTDDGIEYGDEVGRALDVDEEKLLTEKNRERWVFLKRISYLQRCASKQKAQEEEPKANKSADMTTSLDKSDTKESLGEGKPPNVQANANNDTPVTTLDDQGIENAIDTFVSTGDPNYNQFIDPYGFEDPLEEEFYEDVWYANAVRNTRIYRMIFHCQPDDAAETWSDYTRFYNLESDFEKAQKQEFAAKPELQTSNMANGGEAKAIETPASGLGVLGLQSGEEDRRSQRTDHEEAEEDEELSDSSRTRESVPSSSTPSTSEDGYSKHNLVTKSSDPEALNNKESQLRKKRRAGTFASRHRHAAFGDTLYDKQTAEKFLSHIQGHLVLFPADWLHKELEKGGSWFFNADRLPPIEIYD